MNDDPRLPELDDQQALAVSAVVDGTADAADRALVAGSPALQAWVEEQRKVRDQLTEVPIASSVRESAIAAALAAFDDLLGSGDTVEAPVAAPAEEPLRVAAVAPVVPLAERARRRWQPRSLLGAAAAVVAVLAIGGVAITLQQSDDDAGDTALVTTATMRDGIASDQRTGAADTMIAADEPLAEAGEPSDDNDAAGAAPMQTISDIPSAADVEDGATAVSSAEASGDTAAPAETTAAAGDTPSTFDAPPAVADPDALRAYVDEVDQARKDGGDAAPPSPATVPGECTAADDDVLGLVVYGADALPSVVVRDVSGEQVRAIAVDTCDVLVVLDV